MFLGCPFLTDVFFRFLAGLHPRCSYQCLLYHQHVPLHDNSIHCSNLATRHACASHSAHSLGVPSPPRPKSSIPKSPNQMIIPLNLFLVPLVSHSPRKKVKMTELILAHGEKEEMTFSITTSISSGGNDCTYTTFSFKPPDNLCILPYDILIF